MRFIAFALLTCLLVCVAYSKNSRLEKSLAAVDVIWTSPSIDASGSMPIGNGEVVLNTWVEAATGDLMILIARTDAMSEISRVMKLGRLRISFSPGLFRGRDFSQRLRLHDGRIEFSGDGESLRLFVDANANVIHLAGTLKQKRTVKVQIESWRKEARKLLDSESASAWSAMGAPVPLVESADSFHTDTDVSTGRAERHEIGWHHTNKSSIVPTLLAEQSLTGLEGTFDPLLGRTFGAIVVGKSMVVQAPDALDTTSPQTEVDISVATHTCMSESNWLQETRQELAKSVLQTAEARSKNWWANYWGRAFVFVSEPSSTFLIPDNTYPLRRGVDSGGQNKFAGTIHRWNAWTRVITPGELSQDSRGLGSMPDGQAFKPISGLSLKASITLDEEQSGRIFDKLEAGKRDGFLLDTYPGRSLRLIVGETELVSAPCLTLGKQHEVTATFDAKTGEAALYVDNVRVAYRGPETGSMITRGYTLQRYVQACQGRGALPIKFNGGFYTVEPTAMGKASNPDFRNWGDAHWFQNIRHIYHPMLASGDTELMEPFFRLYEKCRPLAESRAEKYHGAEGVYFPETMTIFGTYAGNDYGWKRDGLLPKDVQCPWWQWAWNQGPELVGLMLDRWDYTCDEVFLKQRALPMAESILLYFESRFKKDSAGKLIIDPTQVVETYWEGVVNDLPTTAGLISITDRLLKLPSKVVSKRQREFFASMRAACPDVPMQTIDGKRELAPAQKFVDKTSNCENAEMYAVWPFRLMDVSRTTLLPEAKRSYAHRKNRLDVGWGYDGNAAAMMGMSDEAARILQVKVRNSNPAYRWPATWGPNFDWLPDQNHGGNLLMTTQLMLMQCDSLEDGGKIRLLPAWPRGWDVHFKLHAPGNTTVEVEYKNGVLGKVKVIPDDRAKDIVLPDKDTKLN